MKHNVNLNLLAKQVSFYCDPQRINDLDKEFLERLIALLRGMPVELKDSMYIGSAKRYTEEQEELYKKYRSGRGGLAAKPGTSMHEFGLAVDFRPKHGVSWNAPGTLFAKAMAWMYRYGPDHGIEGLSVIRNGEKSHDPRDPLHFQKMEDFVAKPVPEPEWSLSETIKKEQAKYKRTWRDWLWSKIGYR